MVQIPQSGPLCRGHLVELGWPREEEFDLITALRNRPAVCRRFLDPRPLGVDANREWLRDAESRPDEALLAIRLADTDRFCGTIGWTRWDRDTRSLEIGRLMVDSAVTRRIHRAMPADYPGIGTDAATALCAYGFTAMNLLLIRSVHLAGNAQAAKVNLWSGGRMARVAVAQDPQGRPMPVVHYEMTRADWLALPPERRCV